MSVQPSAPEQSLLSAVAAPAAPSFLRTVAKPLSVITPLAGGSTYPEVLAIRRTKYNDRVLEFGRLAQQAASSADLLAKIRNPETRAATRMAYLKVFRRCISTSLDTEMAKKIEKVSTADLCDTIGHTFKDISLVRSQFAAFGDGERDALAALMGENDDRGKSGYELTDLFFSWFASNRKKFSIIGPRGAGPDVELSTLFPKFDGNFPCDFVIRDASTEAVRAVGFARYDASRGGAQSDDRTGGNSDKVFKARKFCESSKEKFRVIFLAEGPGLAHSDTWEEACLLDGAWDDNVRVTTLKLADTRLTDKWLAGGQDG
jgi:hypothetical protein